MEGPGFGPSHAEKDEMSAIGFIKLVIKRCEDPEDDNSS
jgi:hypothetical protein